MADYQYINETGTIVPDTSTIQAAVEQEYKNAFGEDLDVSANTPQGILITAEVLARTEVVDNNAALANQINPNLAGGVFLSAILALTGATRNPAVKTVVSDCKLTGVEGTIIAAGSRVRDTVLGEEFESTDTVTLTGSPAEAKVDFRAINPGAFAIAEDTLTQIVSQVLGWETVTNPEASIPGTSTQSDASARALRRVTLASQGSSLPEAIISALYEVEGVKSLSFRENVTDEIIVIDDVPLLPHSLYACVDGGTSLEVATAILSKKSGGCNYNGEVTVDVTEPFSGQVYPVKFSRPEVINILIEITIRISGSVSDPEAVVKNAILTYTNGELDGERGFIVGGNVSAFEIAGAVTCQFPQIYVKEVRTAIDTVSPVYSTDEIPILISQKAFTNAELITVIPE